VAPPTSGSGTSQDGVLQTQLVIEATDKATKPITGISGVIAGLGKVAQSVSKQVQQVGQSLLSLGNAALTPVRGTINFLDQIDKDLRKLGNRLGVDIYDVIGQALSQVQELLIDEISNARQYALSEFGILGNDLLKALGITRLSGQIAQIPTQIANGFRSLAGRVSGIFSNISQRVGRLIDPSKLAGQLGEFLFEARIQFIRLQGFIEGAVGIGLRNSLNTAQQSFNRFFTQLSVNAQVLLINLANATQQIRASLGGAIANSPLLNIFGQVGQQITNLAQGAGRTTAGFANIVKSAFTSGTQAGRQFAIGLSQQFNTGLEAVGNRLRQTSEPFVRIARSIGQRVGNALQQPLVDLDFSNVPTSLLNAFDRGFLDTQTSIVNNVNRLNTASSGLQGLTLGLSGFEEAKTLFGGIRESVGQVYGTLARVSQEITFFSIGLQQIKSVVLGGPFELLIGQNVRLQEQLLATKSTLAATTDVFRNGTQITDPTETINALGQSVDNAIKSIREGSLELVGVTSNQLIETFQIMSGLIFQVGGGIDDAATLTLDFAAALGTLGIPLFQARQEVTSILLGQIDQNSALAKSLNLTNQQVNLWKTQGRLVEELSNRLDAFRAGNALAARTINGVASNIQEVIELIGQAAGAPLLDRVVAQLEGIYNALNTNRGAIEEFVSNVVSGVAGGLEVLVAGIGDVFAASQEAIAAGLKFGFEALTSALISLGQALSITAKALTPFLNALAAVAPAIRLLNPLFAVFVTLKTLTAGFNLASQSMLLFAKGIPGVGELLFLMQLRTSNVAGALLGLRKSTNVGIAGLLSFGQNLGRFPGVLQTIGKQIPFFGQQIAGLIPGISRAGIAIIALGQKFAPFGAVLQQLNALIPQLIGRFLTFAKTIIASGNSANFVVKQLLIALSPLFPALDELVKRGNLIAFTTGKASGALAGFRASIVKTIASTALFSAASFGLFFALDKLVFQNEKLKKALEGLGEIVANAAQELAELVRFLSQDPFVLTASIIAATVAVGALIFRLRALIATQITSFVISFSQAMLALATAASTSGAGGAIIAARNAITQLTIAANSGAGANIILARSFQSVAASAGAALTVLLPLALAIAGIAAIITVRYTKALEESTKATEEFRKINDQTLESGLPLREQLAKAAQRQAEANEKGVRLSEEEYENNQLLLAQGKNYEQLLRDRARETAAAAQTARGANRETLKNSAEFLKAQADALAETTNQLQIQAKELPRLGTAYEQLAFGIQTARDALERPSGDPAIFAKQVQQLVDFNKQLLDLGAITADQASADFAQIASLATADKELQIKAQQAITDAYQAEARRRVETIESQQAEIEALIATGRQDDISGQREISALRAQSAEIEREAIQKAAAIRRQALQDSAEQEIAEIRKTIEQAQKERAAAYGDPQAAKELADIEVASLQERRERVAAALEESNKELAKLRKNTAPGKGIVGNEAKKAIEEERAQIQSLTEELSELDTSLAETQANLRSLTPNPEQARQAEESILSGQEQLRQAQERNNRLLAEDDRRTQAELTKNRAEQQKQQAEAALKLIDRQVEEALEISKRSETERLIEVQKLRNQGVILAEQASEQEALLKQRDIEVQIRLERQRLAEFERLRQEGIGVNEEEVEKSQQRLLQLTLDSTKQQEAVYDAYINTLRAKLNLFTREFKVQVEEQNLSLEQQLGVLTSLNGALDTQQKLLQSRQSLSTAVGRLADTEIGILEKSLTSESDKQQLARTTATLKVEAALRQLELEKQSLAIEERQTELALQRKQIENEIAITKSQIDLQQAQAEVQIAQERLAQRPQDREAQLALLEAQLGARRAGVGLQGALRERGLLGFERQAQQEITQNNRDRFAADARNTLLPLLSDLAQSNLSGVTRIGVNRRTAGPTGNLDNKLRQNILNSLGVNSVGQLNGQAVTRLRDVFDTGLQIANQARSNGGGLLFPELTDGQLISNFQRELTALPGVNTPIQLQADVDTSNVQQKLSNLSLNVDTADLDNKLKGRSVPVDLQVDGSALKTQVEAALTDVNVTTSTTTGTATSGTNTFNISTNVYVQGGADPQQIGNSVNGGVQDAIEQVLNQAGALLSS
jgi:hypothetical protein